MSVRALAIQWGIVAAALLGAVAVGWALSKVIRLAIGAATRRTSFAWDDDLLARLAGPMTLTATLGLFMGALPFLRLEPTEVTTLRRVARTLLLVALFWGLWRTIEVSHRAALRSVWARGVPSSRALIPLGARVAKALIVAVAAIAVLAMFGYPVASLIAGLGLGGLAFALAAQKTVENLFGAFSIGVDQPFREGDFVKIEDFVATVEAIGLRSTRFRTLDRTLISIPNGKLADMRLESFTERDRLRLATVIGLAYETTAEQMRSVRQGFEDALRAHPKIWPDAVVVRFREFGASSLDIEIMAWFLTSDWGEFQRIREDILLQFMEVVERAGTSIAFPTRTLHIASLPQSSPGPLAASPGVEVAPKR
jgi:MscS family membrane protein